MKIVTTIIIFVSIIFMSIGYSALNSEISISGEALVHVPKSIDITNVYTKNSINGASEVYTTLFTEKTSNMGIMLPNDNSEITIVVEITNETSDYYQLDDVVETINNNPDIKYEILDKELLYFHPGTVTEIEITFSYETYNLVNQILNLNLEYSFKKITYKNLDYIIFSGNEYIETNLSNTGDYIFETEFNHVAFSEGDGGWIISGRTIAAYTLGVFNGKSGVFNGYGGTTYAKSPYITLNTWYTLYFSRFKHTIGSYNYSVNGGKIIPIEYEEFIRIGGATAGYTGGVDLRHFRGYMKTFKITNAENGEVLRYYVPAEIVEGDNIGEIGYWDIINDVFCGNDGTGAFLAP